MTFRFAAFFLLVSAVLIASPAALRGMAPGGSAVIAASWLPPLTESLAGRPSSTGTPSGPMTLAAASAEFLACKDKCYKQYNCEAMPSVMNPARAECGEKRRACVRACPK